MRVGKWGSKNPHRGGVTFEWTDKNRWNFISRSRISARRSERNSEIFPSPPPGETLNLAILARARGKTQPLAVRMRSINDAARRGGFVRSSYFGCAACFSYFESHVYVQGLSLYFCTDSIVRKSIDCTRENWIDSFLRLAGKISCEALEVLNLIEEFLIKCQC